MASLFETLFGMKDKKDPCAGCAKPPPKKKAEPDKKPEKATEKKKDGE